MPLKENEETSGEEALAGSEVECEEFQVEAIGFARELENVISLLAQHGEPSVRPKDRCTQRQTGQAPDEPTQVLPVAVNAFEQQELVEPPMGDMEKASEMPKAAPERAAKTRPSGSGEHQGRQPGFRAPRGTLSQDVYSQGGPPGLLNQLRRPARLPVLQDLSQRLRCLGCWKRRRAAWRLVPQQNSEQETWP